ncbi:MAG: response regulator [Lachnospiraceae bacterium]|nr:response regulator [Lachnospiraceae bacterium]MDD6191501.1 response regulator [Lachnospiraceae bacterium]MDY4792862.1 response regulator [Pararoseburia sp.]
MNVIYVDDEFMQLQNFKLTAESLEYVDSLNIFDSGKKALEWVDSNPVDVAFLDIEMPEMNGIELARRLKKADRNIRLIFVTAYEQYALQAFGVDAIGYLLKPYDREDIKKQLEKAYYVRDIPRKKIQIKTMPDLALYVDGSQVVIGHTKQAELLALFVDRGEAGLTKNDAMETLWAEFFSESVYWTTMSRLKSMLDKAGISDLIITKGQSKYINVDSVDCDLYRMLKGDESVIRNYQGEYLKEYPWAQSRQKILDEIKNQ